MDSRNGYSSSSRPIMSPRRVTNQVTTSSTSPASRRLYTTSSSMLGGSSSAADAREAQERANKAQVAIHEEKLQARKKKQLEEKMARYSYLIGNTLGKSDLTMQQVRQLQDESYSQIATAALRETQQDEGTKNPVELHQESAQEVGKNLAMSMREIRIQQQEKYNAAMQKKSDP